MADMTALVVRRNRTAAANKMYSITENTPMPGGNRSSEHGDSHQHRAMRHIMRAQQLLQPENSSQHAFGGKHSRGAQHNGGEPPERRMVRIQTVEDVHRLTIGMRVKKSKHVSMKDVHRELVRAFLANLHDEPMKQAIVVLLQSTCKHIKKTDCTAGKVASCRWSQSWLSWVLGKDGKCEMVPTLNILSKDLPKSIIGSALTLVHLLRYLKEQNTTTDDSCRDAIRNACLEFANNQPIHTGAQVFQDKALPLIQGGMREKGMIANAHFIHKHVLPSMLEMDETEYNALHDVKIIYASMQVYQDLFRQLCHAIRPGNPVWQKCKQVLAPAWEWKGNLSHDQMRIGESAVRAVVLLATALFYASETQDDTNLSMLLVLMKALPPCINVLKCQIRALNMTKKPTAFSAELLEYARRCVYGKRKSNRRFGLSVLSTVLDIPPDIDLLPPSIGMNSENITRAEQREKVRQDTLRTIEGGALPHFQEGTGLMDRGDFGSDYMRLMSMNTKLGNSPLREWPLLGTSDSIVSSSRALSAQLNAGVRLLTVQPYLKEFNVDGTPVVQFHSNDATHASYDVYNLIGDVMSFFERHGGEVVTIYFRNVQYDRGIGIRRTDAMKEILEYFCLNIPGNKLVLDHGLPYRVLCDKGQQLLIRTDTLNQDATTLVYVRGDEHIQHMDRGQHARTFVFDPETISGAQQRPLKLIASMVTR